MAKKDVKEEKKEKKVKDVKEDKEVKEKVAEEVLDEKISTEEFTHLDKRTSRYKHLLEKYKKRNRTVEIVIACIIVIVLFFVACNKTFLSTSYTKKVGNSNIEIDLPRFTYYIGSDDDEIIFKTLRKSENTRAFFEDFLVSGVENGEFDLYYCGDSDTPHYYSSVGKYFISDITVEKTFAIKTVTINYSTADIDSYCNTIEENK